MRRSFRAFFIKERGRRGRTLKSFSAFFRVCLFLLLPLELTGRCKKSQAKMKRTDIHTDSVAASPDIARWLLLIVAATVIVYLPIFNNSITNWDDDQYFVHNPLVKELSIQNVQRMFWGGTSFYMGNYHPLTIFSIGIDYYIGGKGSDPAPPVWMFQFTNLLLHTVNTCLVFWLILLLFMHLHSKYASHIAAVTAFLFGVHTLHVESVAWMSERKDVLYSLFFLLSLIAYIKYLARSKYPWLGVSIFLFALSLFSKGQAVSLAVTLLAVDFLWGRNQRSLKPLIEKLPFIALGALFGIIALKAQSAGDALLDLSGYRIYERILFACYSFTLYLVKLVLPVNLSAYYPYLYSSGKLPAVYFAFPIVFCAVIFVFFLCRTKAREISFCIAFFVLNIVLLLQLIPAGSAIMADRYVYIPGIGVFLLAGIQYAKMRSMGSRQIRIANTVAAIYISLLMILTFNRIQVWRDGLTLWTDATNKQPTAQLAWNNLGTANIHAGNPVEAISSLDTALRIDSKYAKAWFNRGTAKKNYGDGTKDAGLWRSALEDYSKAIELKPVFPEAYYDRGIVRDLLGDFKGELEDFGKAIDQKLDGPDVYLNRGVALGKSGKLDEAIDDFNKALAIDGRCAQAYENRGLAKFKMRKYREAVEDYDRALEIKPDLSIAFYNRGLAKYELQDYGGAIDDFNAAAAQKPGFGEVYLSRGLSYMKVQRYQEAVSDFDIAANASPEAAEPRYQKYLALRNLERKDLACQTLAKAVQLGIPASPADQAYCRR